MVPVDIVARAGLSQGMRSPVPVFLLFFCVLSGCAGLSFGRGGADSEVPVTAAPGAEAPRPQARPGAAAAALSPRGRTAEALDTTTAAERSAAAEAAARAGGQALGQTLAGLGAPGEPGFWLVTGLVDRVRPGRVRAPSGAALAVELRPSGGPAGGGGQLSLAAIRALGLPLTELTTLEVFALD